MLTIKVQKEIKAAEKYMEEHLITGTQISEGEDRVPQLKQTPALDQTHALSEYYDDPQMKWCGALVNQLNLDRSEPITQDQFKNLLHNKHPITGSQLTARTVEGRRLYFDATFSAPKSVSIMAITMGDLDLIKAHDLATQETLKELELMAQTRVRKNGAYDLRKTESILSASVVHATSRANDPQLHSHNLIFNVTWDAKEKQFKALEASEIYQNTNYLTEIYRHKLAEKVLLLGYEIERHKQGWEIVGIDSKIRKKFSKRSNHIGELIEAKERELGRALTNNEKAIITQHSRNKKSKSKLLNELINEQQSELNRDELNQLKRTLNKALLRKNQIKTGEIQPLKLKENELEKAYTLAKNHLFERQSVVHKKDLLITTAKDLYGKIEMKEIIALMNQDQDLYEGESDQVGSISGLAQELEVNHFVNTNQNKFELNIDLNNETLNDLKELKSDQKNALIEILKQQDHVMVLDGPAGTGKTYLLKKLVQILEQNHISVESIAPTASATAELTNELKIKSQTLQKYLYDFASSAEENLTIEKSSDHKSDTQSQVKIATKKYLIVDEAGLISMSQMKQILKSAEKNQTQVLLVGDTRQHHSVESGDALRSIKKYSNVKIAQLHQVMRQKELKYKEIVGLIQDQKLAQAWSELDKKGDIKESNLMILDEFESHQTHPFFVSYNEKLKKNKSVIVITPTRFELEKVTNLIRNEKFRDYRGDVFKKEVYKSLRFTEAEKRNFNSYVIDSENPQILNIQKSYHHFKKNEMWIIEEKNNEGFIVKNGDQMLKLNHSDLEQMSFDVVQKKELELKINDLLVIQKNNKEKGLMNGEIVKIKEFKEQKIILENGQSLDLKDQFLDYGYVTTSYSSQGKTCDHVMVSMSNLGGKAISAEQFYVSMSRGKESAEIYVESKDYVSALIEKLGTRTLNQEILQNQNLDQIIVHPEIQKLNIQNIKLNLQNLAQQNKLVLSNLEKVHSEKIKNTKFQDLNLNQVNIQNSYHLQKGDNQRVNNINLNGRISNQNKLTERDIEI